MPFLLDTQFRSHPVIAEDGKKGKSVLSLSVLQFMLWSASERLASSLLEPSMPESRLEAGNGREDRHPARVGMV